MYVCICQISLGLSIGQNRIFGFSGALVVFVFLPGYNSLHINLVRFAVTWTSTIGSYIDPLHFGKNGVTDAHSEYLGESLTSTIGSYIVAECQTWEGKKRKGKK